MLRTFDDIGAHVRLVLVDGQGATEPTGALLRQVEGDRLAFAYFLSLGLLPPKPLAWRRLR
jgi:hypothetical protein